MFVLVFAILAGCLDTDDYGACLERAEERGTIDEACFAVESGVACPDVDGLETFDRLDGYSACKELRRVLCGPASELAEDGQCCYVVRVRQKLCDG
jgi:hypothetical protein